MKNIVVLISGNGTNLQAIIDATIEQQIPAKVACVISNDAGSFGLKRAEKAKIPAFTLRHQDFISREAFEQSLQALIDSYDPDAVVLAGFMRILTGTFVNHYKGRLFNIHPSLLPKYPGLNTYQRALAAGETEHGTSVHFVTENLDGGPLILQALVPILQGETETGLVNKTQQWEYKIYPVVLKWFITGRLAMRDNAAYLDGKKLPVGGLTISNGKIESALL